MPVSTAWPSAYRQIISDSANIEDFIQSNTKKIRSLTGWYTISSRKTRIDLHHSSLYMHLDVAVFMCAFGKFVLPFSKESICIFCELPIDIAKAGQDAGSSWSDFRLRLNVHVWSSVAWKHFPCCESWIVLSWCHTKWLISLLPLEKLEPNALVSSTSQSVLDKK